MPPTPTASNAMVTGVVCFYLVAALSMVMANKWVLNITSAPMFFLLTQLAIAVVLFVSANAMRILPDRLTFDLKICKALFPMVALSLLSLTLSNFTLKYVDASFYQVARGLVLPFTVAISGFVLHTSPSLRILVACALVTSGFFVGVFLDGTALPLTGVGFGVASSTVTALHSVVIKQSLNAVNGSAILLSWYTHIMSVVALSPIVLFFEGPAVSQLLFPPLAGTPDASAALRTFIWGSLITGGVGFSMSLASLLSIKVTSPITHMVSSAVRGVAASLLGVWLFKDVVTSGRASSIFIILAGSVYYTWVKHQEGEAARQNEKEAAADVRLADMEGGKGKEGAGA
ncbi:hypothetical protein FB45DRAFT_941505 [Roridomyces roridus]|uniref:Sugar phosphate transporter domain-containing protein n=1 Tax=Roridomyces roridus TaxID=1738132 RepID=A0AAD7B5K8_9AGAR|nr:hypothetical protein FB45DRAFT_941505 [Roridomyces roridus]